MITVIAVLGTLVLGLVVGLALRGCLVLGNRRELDVLARRLAVEQRIDNLTRTTLAAMRQVARDSNRR